MNQFVEGFVLAIGIVALAKGSFMCGQISNEMKHRRANEKRIESNSQKKESKYLRLLSFAIFTTHIMR